MLILVKQKLAAGMIWGQSQWVEEMDWEKLGHLKKMRPHCEFVLLIPFTDELANDLEQLTNDAPANYYLSTLKVLEDYYGVTGQASDSEVGVAK